ncbi:hypothetical protein V1291_000418 [Nitrobacteraceae bacterium AZCC 1564]
MSMRVPFAIPLLISVKGTTNLVLSSAGRIDRTRMLARTSVLIPRAGRRRCIARTSRSAVKVIFLKRVSP